jgi:signal transduction histidine kinase
VKGSRFQIILIFGLLTLLGLLAFLQYSWLTQIAKDEKDRLEKRLKLDVERFAEDFNEELQTTYFAFQINDKNWRQTFAERFEKWKQNTTYPQLIKQVMVVENDNKTFNFNVDTRQFTPAESTLSFDTFKENITQIDDKNLALQMPIFSGTPITEEIKGVNELNKLPAKIELIRTSRISNIIGYVLIKLDKNTIKNEILKNLGQKYFPDGDFDFSVISKKDKFVIFQSNTLETADLTVSFFSLKPDNLNLILNKDLLSTVKNKTNGNVIFNQNFEARVSETSNTASKAIVKVITSEKPTIFSGNISDSGGLWNLNVRHKAGSINNFVSKTRNQNLAISFGILTLLGVSISLIFVSTMRAKRFAQRQIEFVSSVSHEFRTPLAVIYSASENLTDGVVDSPENINKYGNLIKREGKKLSVMVEQILEFAGANSGKQKYNFETVEVSQVVENALFECKSLIDEKQFVVEKNINENIFIKADANALSHSIQNLITNSIKYCNGEKLIKISAEKINKQVKITVEDKGIGISNKDLKHIFEPFYRGKQVVDTQIHGNGLGLSLVKQIVEAHGGKVLVESENGKGSKFSIKLDLAA